MLALKFLVVGLLGSVGVAQGDDGCDQLLSLQLKSEIASYQTVVNKIIKTTSNGFYKGKVYESLAEFIDTFGPRLVGTQTLEHAIDYVMDKLKAAGLDNVHGEPVQVPHWERGMEEATLIKPRTAKLSIVGLGGSVGTPEGGITADVLAVESFDELKAKGSEAKGKIVVFAEEWAGSYGATVQYRQYAAVEGAKLGAVATLVRSITPFSLDNPHTGWQDYSDNVTKIPTAALTVEDAQMILRMYRRGMPVKINLKMGGRMLEPAMSRNTVAELQGSAQPNKVVLVSGHMDSWDVGQGAMDDGAGAFISWHSLTLLSKLGLRPRRTLRAVLWTGEEPGLVGAFAYAKAHTKEVDDLIVLMESDEGTFTPQGLTFWGSPTATCIVKEIVSLLKPINASQLAVSSDVGSDIMVWSDTTVPRASLLNENENYFWYHHSAADTMTVLDPDTLDKCLAVWAATSYVMADLSIDLPRT